MEKELALQQSVTRQFAPVAAQQIANVSDYLGNTRNYQKVAGLKADWEQQLAQAQTPEQQAELQQNIAAANQYLSEHQAAYDLWKEGGIGRSLLHAGSGALLTGGADGALASGSTALAAPYLNEISGKLDGGGKVLFDTLSGAAIGLATGGNTGALAAGANTDWNNRQLHPDERKWIVNHAKDFARRLNGGREPTQAEIAQAERRLAQQAAKDTDLLWMITLPKTTDTEAQAFLESARGSFTNQFGKSQRYFTTQGRDFIRPDVGVNTGATEDLAFYRRNLISRQNSNIVQGSKDLARKVGGEAWEEFKADPIQGVLTPFAAIGNGIINTAKGAWNCRREMANCGRQVVNGAVEYTTGLGTSLAEGKASLDLDDLRPIYGQDVRGAQKALLFAQGVEALASAREAARLLSSVGTGVNKARQAVSRRGAAVEVLQNTRRVEQAQTAGKAARRGAATSTQASEAAQNTRRVEQAQNAGRAAERGGAGTQAAGQGARHRLHPNIHASGAIDSLSDAQVKAINTLAREGDRVVVGDGRPRIRDAKDVGVRPEPPPARDFRGRTVGKSRRQNAMVQDDIKRLREAGVEFDEIRIDQQQVNAAGCRVGICRPDTQITILEGSLSDGRRLYIEYDRASSNRGRAHARRLLSNDPNAIVILKTVD